MNKGHIPPVRSLLDPRPIVAWPDTTEVFCGSDVPKQPVSQNPHGSDQR